jgi:hypothetical protein
VGSSISQNPIGLQGLLRDSFTLLYPKCTTEHQQKQRGTNRISFRRRLLQWLIPIWWAERKSGTRSDAQIRIIRAIVRQAASDTCQFERGYSTQQDKTTRPMSRSSLDILFISLRCYFRHARQNGILRRNYDWEFLKLFNDLIVHVSRHHTNIYFDEPGKYNSYWSFGLLPSSRILKNTTFRKLHLFESRDEVARDTFVGPARKS